MVRNDGRNWSYLSSLEIQMTTTKPITAENYPAGRELDVCVAKAKGWSDVKLTPIARSKRITKTVTVWTGFPPTSKSRKVVPRFSTDDSVAIKALWPKDKLVGVLKYETNYRLIEFRIVGASLQYVQVLSGGDTVALCLATLEGSDVR